MSAKLRWSDAIQMLQAYQGNSRAIIQNPPSGSTIVKGFRVDRADMEMILTTPTVQDIIIMPAVKLADVAKPQNEQAFTMVVAGTDSLGDIVESAVVDYMTECPANCPKKYPTI